MIGIPIDCISTFELSNMVRANRALVKEAIKRFEGARPMAALTLRNWAESDARNDGGTAVVGITAVGDLERYAVARLILLALHEGRIELLHRDAKTGERLRFEGRHFQDNQSGYEDIAAGNSPLLGPYELRDLVLFIPKETAQAWIKAEFQSLASAPLPDGFVTIQYLENRLTRICRQRGEVAKGILKPYTDDNGNWINQPETEEQGRLRGHVHRLILDGLKSGRLTCEYWRMDSGYRLHCPTNEWSALNDEGGRGLIALRMTPNWGKVLADGVDVQTEAALFGNLIFELTTANSFLEQMARNQPVPIAQQRRGRRPKYDWSACYAHLDGQFEHNGELMEGDPDWNAQADVERAAAQYFSNRGEYPVTSTVRQRVAGYLANRLQRLGRR